MSDGDVYGHHFDQNINKVIRYQRTLHCFNDFLSASQNDKIRLLHKEKKRRMYEERQAQSVYLPLEREEEEEEEEEEEHMKKDEEKKKKKKKTSSTFTSTLNNNSANDGDFQWKPRVVAIASGDHHFLMLDESGRIWGMGIMKLGQRFSKRIAQKQLRPRLIGCVNSKFGRNELGKTIFKRNVLFKKIACGSYHNLAISKDGDLYTWGQNHFRQCGFHNSYNGHNDVIDFPHHVLFYKNNKDKNNNYENYEKNKIIIIKNNYEKKKKKKKS